MNLINGFQIFKKYKPVLTEILIEYYGHEYADLIKEKLNNVYYSFSSTPVDDYKYLITHANEFSYREILMTQSRYFSYKSVEEKTRSICSRILKKKIMECFKIADLKLDSDEETKFLSLFFKNDFRSSYIDYFSSRSLNILKDPNMPDDIIETIVTNRKRFRELLGEINIKKENLKPQVVDEFIKCRENIRVEYQKSLVNNCKFGKDIYNGMKKMSCSLEDGTLVYLCFRTEPCAGTVYDGKEGVNCEYLKFPLTHLANLGIKSLDVSLMHELIHKIGNHKYLIINEIRVQMLALKLTKKLHDRGIFIFDNPLDYKLEGESKYEILFPLAYDFLEEFEDLFRQCAIGNNEEDVLENNFGSLIKMYCDYLNYLFESTDYYSLNEDNYNYVKKLIESMKKVYRNNVVEDVLRKFRKTI